MADERPTPRDEDIPGGFPVTPSINSVNQLTPTIDTADRLEAGFAGRDTGASAGYATYDHVTSGRDNQSYSGTSSAAFGASAGGYLASQQPHENTNPAQQNVRDTAPPLSERHSSSSTILAPHDASIDGKRKNSTIVNDDSPDEPVFAPIKSNTNENSERPPFEKRKSHRTEEDLFRVLSRRKTNASTPAEKEDEREDNEELERLMSRIFGQKRQQQSEEEKTRHSGVVFRGLTVRGVGLGSSLQPTVGDFFMGLPRKLAKLFTQGPKAAIAKPPVRELISNFDGCVRPGELLLVLGRPGAGCSTFLKTFCNQRAGFESVEGDVTYGGTDSATMAKDFRGEIIYNPEDDLHYATLSVKRTLKFALQTRTPGKESRLEGETREDYVREFLRVVTKLFWIEHTLGTKVGNEFIRGVSGGERKRVSIAEAMITRASVQGWDNSSKGLDASTAVEYVKSIRAMTNMADTSTAVSLYQAGEQLYDLADKVLLIDNGKCLYFGRTEDAKNYFLNLGFDCPERWTTADFLTSVTDDHERSIRKGWENRIPRTPDEFSDAYRRSEDYQKNLHDIDEFEAELQTLAEQRRAHESEKSKKKNYEIAFHKQVMACTHRQFLVMFGDKASLFGKWGGLLFQGLIVGSLFFNLPDTAAGAFPRGGALFFLLLFNALLALAEQTAAFESKPILLKHKSFSFYRPSAFAIAQTVVDVPLVFIQVIIFNVLIYFMANLARTASQFFISCLILWLVTMVTYAFFRAISAWCGTLDVATRFTGVAIQILVVYTGYLIPPDSMHPWFAWLRWINWIQYGFECLMANEFYNLTLNCEGQYLVPQGPGVQPQNQGCALAGSTPGSTTVSGADYIQQSFTYTRSHLWRNFGFLWAFFIFFVFLTALGMEHMKPNVGGGAITVFKRGQVPKKVEESIATGGRAKGDNNDEESGRGNPVATGDAERTRSDEQVTQEVAKNETVFTFQNINYTIPFEKGERKLLQDVQGYVRPGKLTALMGASGAGKTTLLNGLAQRLKFGTITGDFLVDGRPLPKSFQRATGFAEQMDIHEPTATVREALQFSALLRQPKEVSKEEKMAYCE
ncbi:brefeldin a resistance, partial [Fusarium longipes]